MSCTSSPASLPPTLSFPSTTIAKASARPAHIVVPHRSEVRVYTGIEQCAEGRRGSKLMNMIIASEASFLVCSMRGFSIYLYIYIFIYIYIYIFQAVRRAVNEMFETPDTVFNNLELLVNPSSTAKKCSATEDCCRNPGGDRHPSSTVKYCSATGLLPNRQRGERPGVNGLPFSHRRKETPVFNNLELLVNRRLRQNRRKRNKPVFNS